MISFDKKIRQLRRQTVNEHLAAQALLEQEPPPP